MGPSGQHMGSGMGGGYGTSSGFGTTAGMGYGGNDMGTSYGSSTQGFGSGMHGQGSSMYGQGSSPFGQGSSMYGQGSGTFGGSHSQHFGSGMGSHSPMYGQGMSQYGQSMSSMPHYGQSHGTGMYGQTGSSHQNSGVMYGQGGYSTSPSFSMGSSPMTHPGSSPGMGSPQHMGTYTTTGSNFGTGTNPFQRGRGPKGYKRSDDRIHEDVCEALSYNPQVDASEVDVKVKEGEVTLMGTVNERRMKRLIEETVENVSGVRDVNNQIRVNDLWGKGEGLMNTIMNKVTGDNRTSGSLSSTSDTTGSTSSTSRNNLV